MPPFFSIITPVLNAHATLPDTIESVMVQRFTDWEWIVQDGGSTDGSQELWQTVPRVDFECKKDGGIYHAMNRAAQRASGEWLVFLQADDWLEPGALAAWHAASKNFPNAVVLGGGCSAVRQNKSGCWQTVWSLDDTKYKHLDFAELTLGEPMLNARAYKRELFLSTGGFPQQWSLAADRAWLLQLSRAAPDTAALPQRVYRYRWHEGSSTMNEGNALSERLTKENLAVAESLLPGAAPKQKAVLLRWHLRESVRLCMNLLEQFRMQELLVTLRNNSAFHRQLPFFFVAEILRCLPGFLLRGGKTKSQLRR